MSKSTPTLALAMIVRDEEANIRRCLDSVVGLVDEMVIVDTGSTDSTRDIIEEYRDRLSSGLRILEFEWCDDFSAARNFGLEHVASDWILALDADEELASDFDSVRALLRDKYDWVFYVNLVVAEDPSKLNTSVETTAIPRLFKRSPQVRYRYPVHEHVYSQDEGRYSQSELVINHFGPIVDPKKATIRSSRNIPIIRKAIEQYPDRPHFQYYLAMEYWNQGELEESGPYFKSSLEGARKGERHIPAAERNLAWVQYSLGNTGPAMSRIKELQREYPDFTDLFFIEGKILGETGYLEPALRVLAICVKMGDPPPNYLSWGGTGSWRARREGEEIWRKNQ